MITPIRPAGKPLVIALRGSLVRDFVSGVEAVLLGITRGAQRAAVFLPMAAVFCV